MKKQLLSITMVFILILTLISVINLSSVDTYADDASITLSIWPQEAEVGEAVTVTVTIKGESLTNCSFELKYPENLVSTSTGSGGVIPISSTGPTQVSYTFVAKAEGNAYFSTTQGQFTDNAGNSVSVVPAGGTLPIGNQNKEETTEEKKEETTEEKKDDTSEDDESGFDYSLDGVVFKIIDKPENEKLPAGFEKAKLKIDDKDVDAYKDPLCGEVYIVYAKNKNGEIGPYYYDLIDGTLSSYKPIETYVDAATLTSATEAANSANVATVSDSKSGPIIPETRYIDKEKDEGFFTRTVLKRLLMLMALLFVILCVVVIVLMIKNGNLQSELYGDDDKKRKKTDADKARTDKSDTDKYNSEDLKMPIRKGKDHTYGVSDDTGEILLEEAEDNNASVDVPPALDGITDIEKAMKERPYGVDSAFDVVASEDGKDVSENAAVLKNDDKHKEQKKESDIDEIKPDQSDIDTVETIENDARISNIFERMEALRDEQERASRSEEVHEVLPDTVELTSDDMEYINKMTKETKVVLPEQSDEEE